MSFNTYITSTIDRLVLHLTEQLACDEDALREALDSFSFVENEAQETAPKVTKAAPKSVSKAAPKSAPASKGCPFEKKDGELCGILGKTPYNDIMYCSTHAKVMAKRDAAPAAKAAPKAKAPVAKAAATAKTPVAKARAPAAPKSKTAAKKLADEKSEDLIEQVVKQQNMSAKRNAWGNWEDSRYHIVFDRVTSKALGNQLASGTIGPLSKQQISLCEANNWEFDAPPPTSVAAKSAPKSTPAKSAPKAKSVPKKVEVVEEEDNIEDVVEDIDLEDITETGDETELELGEEIDLSEDILETGEDFDENAHGNELEGFEDD